MEPIRLIIYSKRTIEYEVADLIGGSCFLSIFVFAIGQQFKSEFINRNLLLFLALMIIGASWFIVRQLIGGLSWYKPYKEAGEIEFTDKFLVLKGERIELETIRKLRIEATQCKGYPGGGRSGTSDGTGNYIEIYLKNNIKHKEKIVIEKVQQRNSLHLLMDDWRIAGIQVIGVWKSFNHS